MLTGRISHGASRRPWCSSVSGIEVPAYKYTVVLDRTCTVRFNFGCNWSISLRLGRGRPRPRRAIVVCSLMFQEDNNYARRSDRVGSWLRETVLKKSSRRNTRIGILKWIIYKYRCTEAVRPSTTTMKLPLQ